MGKKISLLLLCASQLLFSEETNLLQDACGFEVLSPRHIQGLYSWAKPSEVGIGADFHQMPYTGYVENTHSGLIVKDMNEFQTHHLNAISFENFDSIDSSQDLIAEECRILSELPSRKRAMTAMGAPKKK